MSSTWIHIPMPGTGLRAPPPPPPPCSILFSSTLLVVELGHTGAPASLFPPIPPTTVGALAALFSPRTPLPPCSFPTLLPPAGSNRGGGGRAAAVRWPGE
ncbi:hypothetical protein ACQJBY_011489 [Aegilops geniculata]